MELLVVRRLTVSLTLLACLLGIIQSALACVPQGDCCQSGCGQPVQASAAWGELFTCCATAAVGTSVSITAEPRGALQQASGPPALSVRPADFRLPLRSAISAQPTASASAVDESRIYLRTARLRL